MVRSATAPEPWVVRFRAYYYFCRKVERLGPWQSFVTAIQRARKRNYGRDVPKPSEALVWINVDGSARDLTDAEKRHVDADFSPFDGARPYIKSTISSTTDGVSSAVTCNEPKSRTASPSTPPRRKARRSSRPRNRWRVRFRNWSEKVTQDQLARHNRWRAAQPGVRAVSHAPKRRDCPGIGRDMHRYNPQRLL